MTPPPDDGRWMLCWPSPEIAMFRALAFAAWLDGLPVCEPLSLEDTRVDVFARPLAETITSAPELEVWRHRDRGRA